MSDRRGGYVVPGESKRKLQPVFVATMVVIGALGWLLVPGSAYAQSDALVIEVKTTEANVPANGMVVGEQPVELHLEYSGLGSGTHELELMESDSLFDDTIREITVEGDSGSDVFRLSPEEVAQGKDSGPEDVAHLYVRWGEDAKSNTVAVWWQDTTVYTKGYGNVPAEVERGEEITIEYYGWTSESQDYVRLVEDDPLLNSNTGGNDDQIRRESVSGPGYFEGTFTFTPSDYVGNGEESDDELEVQSRPGDEHVYPDIVRAIPVSVTEVSGPSSDGSDASDDSDESTDTEVSGPSSDSSDASDSSDEIDSSAEIDANIADFGLPAGRFEPGDEVIVTLQIENLGGVEHTFYVGFSVRDSNGDYHSGGDSDPRVTVGPGETADKAVSWTVPDGAPTGVYDVDLAVWKEQDPSALETRLDALTIGSVIEVGNPTPISTPTPEPTPTPTPESTSTPTPAHTPTSTAAPETTTDGQPGFGVLAVLSSLACLLLLRRAVGG